MDELTENRRSGLSACRTVGTPLPGRPWVLLAALLLLSCPVLAEDYRSGSNITTGSSVIAHEGIVIGPFLFSPSAKVGATYDDNVFNVEEGFPLLVSSDPDHDGTFTTTEAKFHAKSSTIANGEARLAFKMPFSHSYVQLVYLPQYPRLREPDHHAQDVSDHSVRDPPQLLERFEPEREE